MIARIVRVPNCLCFFDNVFLLAQIFLQKMDIVPEEKSLNIVLDLKYLSRNVHSVLPLVIGVQ